MKAQVEIRLNMPDANKLLFDVDIEYFVDQKTYVASVDFDKVIKKGKANTIDKAVENLLMSMDFVNRPWG